MRLIAATAVLGLFGLLGCGSNAPQQGCPNGQHDGGDGKCVRIGACSPGYALDGRGSCTLNQARLDSGSAVDAIKGETAADGPRVEDVGVGRDAPARDLEIDLSSQPLGDAGGEAAVDSDRPDVGDGAATDRPIGSPDLGGTGGATSTGGILGSGGAIGGGGAGGTIDANVATVDANVATGGMVGTGGASLSAGGSPGTGGVLVGTGGASTSTGGTSSATGGIVGTGGVGTGGASTSTGGVPGTGGAVVGSGGASSGGASGATGGTVGTGGSGTGGAGGTGGATGPSAMFFISDVNNGLVLRYSVTPTSEPVLTATLNVASAWTMALSPTGELLVAQNAPTANIMRFRSPLGELAPGGTISGMGMSNLQWLARVDDELWAGNTYQCTLDPETLLRLSFDSQGNATAAGTVTEGIVAADRGVLWEPTTRSLYFTRCGPVNTIQHLRVATDHSITVLEELTGNGVDNAHGMRISPWGELFVANAGTAGAASPPPGSRVLRFTLDSQGKLTANGVVEGNGIDVPLDVGFLPWGEMLVVNDGDATISRFTFDSSHAAVPHGKFSVTAPSQTAAMGIGPILVMPGTSH